MEGVELLALDNPDIDKVVFTKLANSISTELDGETVILNTQTNAYSSLNEVGTVVWKLLGNEVTIADLGERISAEFDVGLEKCTEDLVPLLKELVLQKLIEVTSLTNQ
jgi:hypothetical protein